MRPGHAAVLAAAFGVWITPAHAQQQPRQPQPPPVAVGHGEHAGAQAGAAGDCMTAQSKVVVTATVARDRIEAARQSNDAAHLRAAVDEALIAITSLLAATEPCRSAPAPGMDHSKMTAPQPQPGGAARPPAAEAAPHAGHAMPGAPAKPAAAPAAGRSAKPAPKPADPHAGMKMPAATPAQKPAQEPAPKPAQKPAGHEGMNMAPPGTATAVVQDPKALKCPQPVNPENVPTATYKGKPYYFCTAAERLRFLLNPETYLKARKGPGK